MDLFPIYQTFDLQLKEGKGCYVYDEDGTEYLDLYGGHAVISVGHRHPKYIKALTRQLKKLAYYSNSVNLPIQTKLARKLGKISGCDDYNLFLCNSGAEAVENAIKLASFHTGRKKVIAFDGSFHGRTHGALAVTDNDKIRAVINTDDHVIRLPFNNEESLVKAFEDHGKEIAAVIIEPVQGVGGIRLASKSFLENIQKLCGQNGAMFIADEVQCGTGRTGKFFSFQHAGVNPHLITVAKGMGNGFPIGGVLISPEIQASFGMLGTTFGGNPLACAAAIAVLDIMKREKLVQRSAKLGQYFMEQLQELDGVIEVRGQGLIIGAEFGFPISDLRKRLLYEEHIFTGSAKSPNVLRFLPPMTISKAQLEQAVSSLKKQLNHHLKKQA